MSLPTPRSQVARTHKLALPIPIKFDFYKTQFSFLLNGNAAWQRRKMFCEGGVNLKSRPTHNKALISGLFYSSLQPSQCDLHWDHSGRHAVDIYVVSKSFQGARLSQANYCNSDQRRLQSIRRASAELRGNHSIPPHSKCISECSGWSSFCLIRSRQDCSIVQQSR